MGSDIDGACGQLRKVIWKKVTISSNQKQKARSDMRVYSATNIGMKRKMNQDYVFASQTRLEISRTSLLLLMEWEGTTQVITLPLTLSGYW